MKPYIHVTKKMTGKMEDMISINTNPLVNKACIARANVIDNICGDCYSMKTMKRYPNAAACFTRNGERLSERLLEDHELPRLNYLTVRFHAHGELLNGTHCANYFAICRANPNTTFTLWTEQVGMVGKVIRDFGKPANLILIKSSTKKNVREELPENFDKVFTVYTKEHKGESFINCGAKKCRDCMTCYTLGNSTVYVNEVVK